MSVQENTEIQPAATTVAPATGTTVANEAENTQQTEAKVETETETETTADAAQTERDDKGRFKGVQPRIDELTRARREAEREASYWKSVAAGQAQTSAEAAPQKPVAEQFNDYGDYVEALTDWKAEQAVAKRMEADSSRKVADTQAQTFMERQSAFRAVAADYDEVVGGSTAPVSAHVQSVILDSERGPELAYYLGKNPTALTALNSLSPLSAAREIGRLEASFAKPATAAEKKFSNTPAPANTTAAQGRATKPSLATANMDEYMAQRKAQGARWAR